MKYLGVIFLIFLSIYPLSFARYSWRKKNRLGAASVILLAAASVIYPAVLMFTR